MNNLKYYEKALRIFNIAAPQSISKTLTNIATTYFKKGSYEKGFEYYAKALSSSLSPIQFKEVFLRILSIVRDMIEYNEWENLKSIEAIYTSGIITDDILISFFTAIHEYALYQKIFDEFHKKGYEGARQKLDPTLREMLDKLTERKK